MLAQGVRVQQRHLAVDHTAGHSVTAPSQDVTVDTTTVNFHTSIQRRTRATRLRIDYVHHCIEERDKAAQNIFFRPKGQSLPTSALNSPRGQHRTASVSAPCSTPLTPTSQHGSSAASLQTPRSTKAAHLRQQAATQRIEEAEKWKLEKGAEEGLAQAAIESASRQPLVSLKAGAPMSSSSKALSVERNGSALGEAAATSSNGAYPSHHTPRSRTSHTGSSADTIVSARERVKTAKRSSSTHSAPREEWRAAVLTYFDDREKALDQQQNVAEATYGASEEVVLDARVSLASAKDLPCKPSDEALTVLRGESTSVKPNESIAVRLPPTACSDNKRMPPHHHCSGRSHTAQCDAGSPSPVALRDVRGTGTAPAVQITEAKMTPREDVRLAQRAASPKSSYQWEGDATSSSSMPSIVFTLLSTPREDIAGEELLRVRQDRPQVPAQGSGALESCDAQVTAHCCFGALAEGARSIHRAPWDFEHLRLLHLLLASEARGCLRLRCQPSPACLHQCTLGRLSCLTRRGCPLLLPPILTRERQRFAVPGGRPRGHCTSAVRTSLQRCDDLLNKRRKAHSKSLQYTRTQECLDDLLLSHRQCMRTRPRLTRLRPLPKNLWMT
ncbi:hypothetical_protein [Leishmania braziliensis MHOM/BR/75/M2904]|uniref:Hypothetical_protein n=1 Tax=Leishmania braziliensis MHOM/BR/75/M2904 TaxID=420245 RepID=A0A3P3ZEB1_LEIBR|nr:hypothetical_protein [Leishmania braziliensis MHOM/BR/75/M2904]